MSNYIYTNDGCIQPIDEYLQHRKSLKYIRREPKPGGGYRYYYSHDAEYWDDLKRKNKHLDKAIELIGNTPLIPQSTKEKGRINGKTREEFNGLWNKNTRKKIKKELDKHKKSKARAKARQETTKKLKKDAAKTVKKVKKSTKKVKNKIQKWLKG